MYKPGVTKPFWWLPPVAYTLKTRNELAVSLLNIFGPTIDVFIDDKMKEPVSHTEGFLSISGIHPECTL